MLKGGLIVKNILLFDATLRDGSHAIKHKLSLSTIEQYCSRIDDAGMETVIVGHGVGLGASSLQVGVSRCSDEEMLKCARKNLKKTKLGIYMMPGLGTIEDNLIPAIDIGVDLFKIGAHCTEADIMKQHIEYLAMRNKEVYGVLMGVHMINSKNLLEEVKKIESYGANGVILMDSAGASIREDVEEKITTLVNNTKIKIGFHAHNSLGLAISNTLSAIDCGATIIDATCGGFGAGAGNCQLEAVIALLQQRNILNNVDLYKIMDASEEIIQKELKFTKGLDKITLIAGISGVHCMFTDKIKEAAGYYNIDFRDIFIELGRRKIVGGQEDMIIKVAEEIMQKYAIVKEK